MTCDLFCISIPILGALWLVLVNRRICVLIFLLIPTTETISISGIPSACLGSSGTMYLLYKMYQ